MPTWCAARVTRRKQAAGKASKRCSETQANQRMALADVNEAYDKGASEDVGRLSIVHDILRKKHRLLEINHRACFWSEAA